MTANLLGLALHARGHLVMSAIVHVFGRRNDGLSTHSDGRRPKSANARSRGKYGTRQCSECYGDLMLVAISMVDAARAKCFHNFRVLA